MPGTLSDRRRCRRRRGLQGGHSPSRVPGASAFLLGDRVSTLLTSPVNCLIQELHPLHTIDPWNLSYRSIEGEILSQTSGSVYSVLSKEISVFSVTQLLRLCRFRSSTYFRCELDPSTHHTGLISFSHWFRTVKIRFDHSVSGYGLF